MCALVGSVEWLVTNLVFEKWIIVSIIIWWLSFFFTAIIVLIKTLFCFVFPPSYDSYHDSVSMFLCRCLFDNIFLGRCFLCPQLFFLQQNGCVSYIQVNSEWSFHNNKRFIFRWAQFAHCDCVGLEIQHMFLLNSDFFSQKKLAY